jgi:ABC-type multidrug transport system ATPase subunit
LDLEIGAHEVVVAIGPNGSGKSTLLRLLATDLLPDRGTLAILGRPAREPLRELRRLIGYAPDTPAHHASLTGHENAEFFTALHGSEGRGSPSRISELLEAFQLGPVRDVPVSEYSLGMLRKLLLAETLAPAPRLLLLDEPTIGLDSTGTKVLRTEIEASVERGATVVIATNDIRELPFWADRVLLLHGGSIVEDAPLSSLLSRLSGATRIDIELGPGHRRRDEEILSEARVSGIDAVEREGNALRIRSSVGSSPLPELVRLLVAAGVPIREVRVREPDLSDLFRAITGQELISTEDADRLPEAERES